jgi:ribonuclease HI
MQSVRAFTQDQLEELEIIQVCPREPWKALPFQTIFIDTNKDLAIQQVDQSALRDSEVAVFTDASEIDGHLGAAAVVLDDDNIVRQTKRIGIGSNKHWTIHAAELIAIYYGIWTAGEVQLGQGGQQKRVYTIFSDAKTALQAIENPSRRSGQHIVQAIIELACFLKEGLQIEINLRWIPSHAGIAGNEIADRMAKEATRQLRGHHFRRLAALQKDRSKAKIYRDWTKAWKITSKGQTLRRIDTATPSIHVRKLYDQLSRSRASLLAQLRTGHSWLNSFRKKIGRSNDDRCECGAQETIVHVFVDCPKLRELRTQLRQKIGNRFNSLSTMLGGKPHENGTVRAVKDWTISRAALDAVLDFAEQSGRFCSRATEE